jgi:hypothetical protein
MNKRVDQLLVKAGAYFGAEGVLYDQFDPKKFAELIIQECAGLTLDHRNADYYQGWLDYRDEIRQHWGIEP